MQIWILVIALVLWLVFSQSKGVLEQFSDRSGMLTPILPTPLPTATVRPPPLPAPTVLPPPVSAPHAPALPVPPVPPVPPAPPAPLAPPPDPVVSESYMKTYVKNLLQSNSLWCADGTCSIQNVKLPTSFTTQFTTVTGRYVKLSQPTVNCMNIGEIQVFSGTNNIAKGKSVTMSSQFSATDFPGTFLVDEIFTNFAHTSCNEKGWMTIDLGTDQPITSIKVYNRQDCCSGRIIGAVLQISNSSGQTVYTSDAFQGNAGQIVPTTGMEGFAVYTMRPPSSTVTGSSS